MKHYLFPDATASSAYDIPYEKLYEMGYRGIIYDIDNTLVPHGAPADKRAIEHFERLRAIGFKAVLLSNNKEPRVKSFNDGILVGEIVNVSADESVLTDGKVDPKKLKPITFDPINNTYIGLGEVVGQAFKDGNKIK